MSHGGRVNQCRPTLALFSHSCLLILDSYLFISHLLASFIHTPFTSGPGGAALPFRPSPFTLHPSPFTLHPSPFTLHPSTFDLRPSTFDLRPSTFRPSDLRPSDLPTFDLSSDFHLASETPNTVRLSNNLEKSNHRLTGHTQMKEG